MIRRFDLGDLTDILRIEAQAFPKSAYTPDLFVRYYRAFPETFLVFSEEVVVGYIIYTSDGHIVSLAIDPAHRRRGIGTSLIKAAESRCRDARLLVEVREGNRGAQKFYERLGFCRTSRIRLYYGNEDAYVMEKKATQLDRGDKK